MTDIASSAGPMFGPDSVVISVEDDAGSSVDIHVYPDTQNSELQAAGQPTQYYFQPPRILLATRQGSADLDFSMTALVKQAPGSPNLEYMGGSCTFASTFALPDHASARVINTLMSHNHPPPPARIALLFNYRRGMPTPELRMVPVIGSAVVCIIEHPRTSPDPIVMTVQNPSTGSIEIQGRNTFLVSLSPSAAQEIVTNLRDGSAPPFVVRNVLTEQFDTGTTTVTADVNVDVDALYQAISAVTPNGGPVAGNVSADVMYQAGVAANAISTDVAATTGAKVDSSFASWLNDADTIKKTAFGMVRDKLFTIDPATAADPGGSAPPWWGSVFGNATVTLKKDHAQSGASLRQTVTVSGTVAVEHIVEGNLDDLAAVAKTNLDTYLTVVDVGAFE